jgi:hypothetical protein
MAHLYRTTLASICNTSFGNLVAEEWLKLVPLINEEVLQEAYQAGTVYSELFSKQGLKPFQRPKKKMSRITIKSSVKRPDVPFKTNSDLCAFRFVTYDVSKIKQTMSLIEDSIKQAGGLFFIRNSIETDGKLNDIVQFAFVFMPEIGYIAEIQVGHPFAMCTFHRDSAIRDKKIAGESTDDIVDLWDNNFYGHVKAKILDPSLDLDVLTFWPSKTVPIDEELKSILARIV